METSFILNSHLAAIIFHYRSIQIALRTRSMRSEAGLVCLVFDPGIILCAVNAHDAMKESYREQKKTQQPAENTRPELE